MVCLICMHKPEGCSPRASTDIQGKSRPHIIPYSAIMQWWGEIFISKELVRKYLVNLDLRVKILKLIRK